MQQLSDLGEGKPGVTRVTDVTHSSSSFPLFFPRILMARSEIDDIFASKTKGRSTVSAATASSSSTPAIAGIEKKKKTKKRKREEVPSMNETATAPLSSKKRAPETVIDPSLSATTPASSRVAKEKRVSLLKRKSKPSKHPEEDSAFADSRGTGPRKHTEEGWAIFKEDELGISAESGGMCSIPLSKTIALTLNMS
jgi:hypothetical protein